jgi:hypothetical protein
MLWQKLVAVKHTEAIEFSGLTVKKVLKASVQAQLVD